MGMKQAYQDKMNAQLNAWQSKIDIMKAKADQKKEEQKVHYYEMIDNLREKQQNVLKKLNELNSASDNAWEELKAGVEFAWHDLQNAAERAKSKFSSTNDGK